MKFLDIFKPKEKVIIKNTSAKYGVNQEVYGFLRRQLNGSPDIVKFTIYMVDVKLYSDNSVIKYRMTHEDANRLKFDIFYEFFENDISDDLEDLKRRVIDRLIGG